MTEYVPVYNRIIEISLKEVTFDSGKDSITTLRRVQADGVEIWRLAPDALVVHEEYANVYRLRTVSLSFREKLNRK